MATSTIDTDTELSAVNSILGAIGQSPVTSINYENPEVSYIYNILTEVNKDVQNEGWHFNTEQHIAVTPDAPAAGYQSPPSERDVYSVNLPHGTGDVNLTVIDPTILPDGINYRIHFKDSRTNGYDDDNDWDITTHDIGSDGCVDEYEDGLGGCLNNDSGLTDANGDNWNDCGSDGTCNENEEGFDPVNNIDPNGDDYDYENIDESKHNVSEKEAWDDQTHAEHFDSLSSEPNFILKKHYESFGEGKLLKKWKPHNGKGMLFEVGCATGEYLHYIKERHPKIKRLVGIDNTDKLLAAARIKLPEIEFHVGDIENNLFKEGEKFDVVTCLGVMACVFDLENAINNLLDLLFPNGHLFLFGIVNEEPIDVQLVYKRSNKEENIWELGKNCYSLETYNKMLSSRCKKVEVLDFDLPFSIEKTKDPLRSWTEEFRGNKNHLFYGTGQIATQKIIIAAK